MDASAYIRSVRRGLGHGLLMLPAVAIVVRDPFGRVLHVQAAANSEWGLPAGGIEPGEEPLAAALRELAEETGLSGVRLELIGSCGGDEFRHEYPNGDRVEYSIFVFGGSVPEGLELEPSDLSEVRKAAFLDRADAPALRLPYPPQLVWNGNPDVPAGGTI